MIIHGHIAVNGKKVRVPSYMVKKSEESAIQYVPSSPFSDDMHPMRPKAEKKTEIMTQQEKEIEIKEGA